MLKIFKDYFKSDIDYNPGASQRMPALDLARCIAMLMMIQGHVIFELTKPSQINIFAFPWNIWEFMRGLTAPTFLMVSGIVNVFANRRDSNGLIPRKTTMRRLRMAIGLILTGYLFLFPADKIYHLLFINFSYWQPFLQVNTLQLIGISLLMLLAVFKLTRNDKQLGVTSFIISMVIFALTPTMHLIHWFRILPEFAAAYLSLKHGSIFTIFPFTGFMFFGVAVGTILKNVEPSKRYSFLMKFGLIFGAIFIAVGIPLFEFIRMLPYQFIDTLKANTGMSFIRIGCILIALSGITFLYLKTAKLAPIYSMFGKKALFIYIAHLVLLYGTPWIPSIARMYHGMLPIEVTTLIALGIQISSLTLAYFYETSVVKFPTARAYFRYSLASLLIYLLFV